MGLPICWICNDNLANSGEHRPKASDLKLLLGKIDQNNRVYVSNESRKNAPAISKRSNRFKTNKIICKRCNDTTTAPYDLAWERLSNYAHQNWTKIKSQKSINLGNVYPGSRNSSATHLQLYFAKLLGCRIVESDFNLTLTDIATALVTDKPVKNFALVFAIAPLKQSEVIDLSEIKAAVVNSRIVHTRFHYGIGEFLVGINWWSKGHSVEGKYFWHPDAASRKLKLRLI